MDKTIDNLARVAVLLLGGSGTRFGSEKPKQFALVGGKLLFLYPLEVLEKNEKTEGILLVAPAAFVPFVSKTLQELGFGKIIGVIPGGETRQDSSRRACEYLKRKGLSPNSIVLVHDADRPNLLNRYLDEGYEMALHNGAAITAVPSNDSVALSDDGSTLNAYAERKSVYLLQTPQAFVFSLLESSHEKASANRRSYTDEGGMVLEESGVHPSIVLGERSNIKITTPGDLDFLGKGKL